MNATETAKLIRKELKAVFPGIKFSVRSKYFSMGSSVNISWTDGATKKEVESVVSKFEKVCVDEYTGEVLSGGNMYIGYDRMISPELESWANEFHDALFNTECNYNRQRKIREILNLNTEYTACDLPEVVTHQETAPPTQVEPQHSDIDALNNVNVEILENPYFVTADFAKLNKNSDISTYIEECQKGDFYRDSVRICYKVKLTYKQWNLLLDGNLLASFDWMEGKGGHSSSYEPKTKVDHFWQLPEEEQELYKKHAYRDDCILVTCGYQSIVIDPQGYSYARYVGINPIRAIKAA